MVIVLATWTHLRPQATARYFVPSADFLRGASSEPPASDTRDWATQQQVGNKDEQESDDDRLSGMESVEHDDLVDRVHTQPQENDPSGGYQCLAQAAGALLRTCENRPKIMRAPGSGILDAVVHCGNRRHDGLEDETESHWPRRAV